jgi:hypothetical protein
MGVVVGLNLRERLVIEVLPPWIHFTMAWNRGVNFGLFASDAEVMRWFWSRSRSPSRPRSGSGSGARGAADDAGLGRGC